MVTTRFGRWFGYDLMLLAALLVMSWPRVKTDSKSAAPYPLDITHALEIPCPRLCEAVLTGAVNIENRWCKLGPGWYALHVGNKTGSSGVEEQLNSVVGLAATATLQKNALVGAVLFSECLSQHLVGTAENWAVHTNGTICNVIRAVIRLDTPIPSMKYHSGGHTPFRPKPDHATGLLAQLESLLAAPSAGSLVWPKGLVSRVVTPVVGQKRVSSLASETSGASSAPVSDPPQMVEKQTPHCAACGEKFGTWSGAAHHAVRSLRCKRAVSKSTDAGKKTAIQQAKIDKHFEENRCVPDDLPHQHTPS